jgi:glutamate-1-semialdehyde aminotransferase
LEGHLLATKKAEDLSYKEKGMNSRRIFEKAKKFLPGGVTYGFRYIEPYPLVKAKGSRLLTV